MQNAILMMTGMAYCNAVSRAGKTECHGIILDSELRWRSVAPSLEGKVAGLPERKGGWAV